MPKGIKRINTDIEDGVIFIVLTGKDDDTSADGVPFTDTATLLAYVGSMLEIVEDPESDCVDLKFAKDFTIIKRRLNMFSKETALSVTLPPPAETFPRPSNSRRNVTHDVWANADHELYHCTCEDKQYNPGKACRHMLEVLVIFTGKGYTLAEGLTVRAP